jgi:dTDP-4-dehydrorhamnose 3,5-epimerase
MMKASTTNLPGVLLLEPTAHRDVRGWFVESYTKRAMEMFGVKVEFVQDNHSFSLKKGTLRGLHFQNEPMAQSKLVRCTRGSIQDVVVDIRKDSPTFRRWISLELTSTNMRQVFVPKGFAHGFVTLEDDTEVQYKVDNYYSKENDRNIRYDDPDIGIEWTIDRPTLSEKDAQAPFLKDSDCNLTITKER